ncbi:helix-turn-helix domain-containing protein [Tsukamurella conjunctivitidis]|uniref:Helix-turn-helix domain-containing protein n=2 Tax=Tsukamurella conjunctivitidis TaxID=2592068 RepID=A0A5C5S300_9ACTN|nr:helix-turn-helix domain-containing protein [Tsukamurella conjunctivitidis]
MRRADGLHLDPADVQFLATLLESMRQRLARNGVTASAQASTFIEQIRSAADRFGEQKRSADVTEDAAATADGSALPHDLLTTAEAAAILGIGAAGVRQLGRRGTLTGYRVGGRWLFAAADVVRRAERRAA